jgi:protein-disulfide isomerase
VQEYVEAGVVRIVYRDFPLEIHPSAPLAAVASRCAANQGAFWPMYELLFATHGTQWGGAPERDRPVMLEFASQLGLDSLAFTSCLNDPATEQAVRDETTQAARLGVNSTPNFFVNNQLLRGALPYETFRNLIEQLR